MTRNLRYQYSGNITKAVAGLLIIAVGFTSCSKFTELTPKNQLADNTVFTDSAQVELALNGVYNAAAIGSYNDSYTAGRGYPFGAASIEQGEMRGEDMVNLEGFYEITYKAQYSTTSANNVNMWVNLYALINQANTFIEGVKAATGKGVISSAKGLQLESEARFLRALAHHELLIHFCRPYASKNGGEMGIPYRTMAMNSVAKIEEGIKVGRGTVAEAYDKILADLDFAEPNLNGTTKFGYNHATQGAVIALKMRVKLHKGDYAGVIAEGVKLGTAAAGTSFTSAINGYALTASPDEPFTKNDKNGESVFSIANSALANGDTNGALASMFLPSTSGGRGLVATSPNLYNAPFWATDDLRRSLMQIKQTTTKDGKPVDNYYFSYKYRDGLNKSDWAPIIRYAEVLLNAAEAYSRTGNIAQAFLLYNAVRNRSLPAASPNRITVPPADMTLAILNERRVEFAGEGRRWPDIHRLALDPVYSAKGIPAKILKADLKTDGSDYNTTTRPTVTPSYNAITYTDYRFIWPIPSTETASNPTLKAQQNPEY
ncbi:RagB/SusD family nutrient uptake outer membrane protein [Chitinophaga qingshengii]|uniref:RagB/SusD family nutrient uptake outer membrane protein n=1 Tax=Chitinophaga qingshengii TaxID=1569794 RepID=A0ABR7TLI4_9BACT|nr:RagB/SusD family nutrient uptake outer membrane protein [Chitinophaga qingshengii]MBC9931355.1 RagB/SusD family nutrient uptake outer membrane protein [Chitinophaga qingshengii]